MDCGSFGSCSRSAALAGRTRLWTCSVVSSFLATLMLTISASAQITTEVLIGDAVSEPSDARYKDVTEAIKFFSNNDPMNATTFLDLARQKNKGLPPTQVLMAKLYYLSGNAAAGQASLEQAVNDDRTDPEPYLILAEQAFNAGQTIIAEALFDRVIELAATYEDNPKRKRNFIIRGHSGRASVAQRRQNWEQAEADLRAWLAVDPENANAHERLGQVLFMQDKESEGFSSFVEASKFNDKLPKPLVSAALMYDRQKNDAKAKASFEKAFAENKDDELTLLAYSQWLLKEGDIAKAETLLAGAQKSSPKSANVWLLSGVAAKMAGKPGPAEQFLMQALNLAPANRDVYNQLALLLIDQPEQEKKNRALEFAGIGQQLNQNSADANVTLAWVLFQLKDARQATAALQKAVQLGQRSADANFLIAKLLLERGDEENAKRFLDAALNYEGIFVQRAEAEALRERLRKK